MKYPVGFFQPLDYKYWPSSTVITRARSIGFSCCRPEARKSGFAQVERDLTLFEPSELCLSTKDASSSYVKKSTRADVVFLLSSKTPTPTSPVFARLCPTLDYCTYGYKAPWLASGPASPGSRHPRRFVTYLMCGGLLRAFLIFVSRAQLDSGRFSWRLVCVSAPEYSFSVTRWQGLDAIGLKRFLFAVKAEEAGEILTRCSLVAAFS
jgi:hypothetical protein